MKTTAIVGIILIVLGVVALAYQGITYTTRKTVVEVGPLEVKTGERRRIPLPPVLGAVAVAGGVVLLIVGSSRR